MSTGLTEIRLSEVLAALSFALDITEGQPEGHAVRNCMIGMSIAEQMDLNPEQSSALFYALLLKDLGCSSNAAKVSYLFGSDDQELKRRLTLVNWSNIFHSARYVIRSAGEGKNLLGRLRHIIVLGLRGRREASDLKQIRCERGADIARQLDFPEETALAIQALDEHWDGKGHPYGLRGEEISLLGRILGFSQTVEVFHEAYGLDGARDVVRQRRGTWFDPAICDIFNDNLAYSDDFWKNFRSNDLIEKISDYEPADQLRWVDDEGLDDIAVAFARVIDAKTPYTYQHSARVAEIAQGMAEEIGMSVGERRELFRAALLHDIGKLGISNRILDKPGKLTKEEWDIMCEHPGFSFSILNRVNGFSQFADMASAHHERLDGKGYHLQIEKGDISMGTRLITVADQFEALTAQRPYREALTTESAIRILEDQIDTGIDPQAFKALQTFINKSPFTQAEGLSDK